MSWGRQFGLNPSRGAQRSHILNNLVALFSDRGPNQGRSRHTKTNPRFVCVLLQTTSVPSRRGTRCSRRTWRPPCRTFRTCKTAAHSISLHTDTTTCMRLTTCGSIIRARIVEPLWPLITTFCTFSLNLLPPPINCFDLIMMLLPTKTNEDDHDNTRSTQTLIMINYFFFSSVCFLV